MDTIILEIEDIKGNCKTEKHEDQINIQSFSQGVSLMIRSDRTGSERTSGQPNVQDFSFVKYSDISTPVLYEYCLSGKTLGEVKIHIGRNQNGEYMPLMEYVLSDAMVSQISTGGGGGDPTDQFSLNFTKITLEYTEQQRDSEETGTATFGWDVTKNIPA